ncbi:hypothetical protein [Rhodococcoides fascians]|nr:hypothetical protein [Rhodococcus fascians]
MASTCIDCRQLILKTERRSPVIITQTTVVGGRTMPIEHTLYRHQECPSE